MWKFLKNMLNVRSQNIAIDLGTANTVIIQDGQIVLDEPSVVATILDHGFELPHLYGEQAKLMLGKTPFNVNVHRPLKDGVIADFKMAEHMIRHFINKVKESRFIRPRVVVCVPFNSTDVERRAIQESVEMCGVKDVFLINEPIAAAIGAMLSIHEPRGSMVVDIGGGTTEIAIISMNGIIAGKSIKLAGNAMDEDIVQHIKSRFNILIGESTAERIKKQYGVARLKKDQKPLEFKIRGRDLSTGIPRELVVSQTDIIDSVSNVIKSIITSIHTILETAPPEIASDIVDAGIVLTGGCALLENIDYAISQETNLPIFIAPDPLFCVVRGCGSVISKYQEYENVLFKQI